MEKEFVPYEIAIKLKELDFNEKCLGYYHSKMVSLYPTPFHISHFDKNSEEVLYHSDCTAPLWQQAFDFFRKNYNIVGNLEYFYKKWFYVIIENDTKISKRLEIDFETYEEARLACLNKLIELCKNN